MSRTCQVIHNSFNGLFVICNIFPIERSVVFKERASHTYDTLAYFLSRNFSEIPRTAACDMVFVVITYFMIDLRGGVDTFFTYFLIVFLTAMCAEGLAYIISASVSTPQEAVAIGPGPMILNMLFGGFFIGQDQIPAGLQWLKHLSFVKYVGEGRCSR